MKKFILPVLFAIPLFAGIFFFIYEGVTKESINLGGRTVVTAITYGEPDNAEGLMWIRIVEAFEAEHPDIDIQYEMLFDEAYHDQLSLYLATGNIPDMAYMGADARWGSIWRAADQFWDHQNFIDKDFFDITLIPEMGDMGEAYYIPLSTSNICTVLYMNEELVASLGFSKPRRYEDLVAMVPAARAAGLDVVSFDGSNGWSWNSCLMSMLIARVSGNPRWISGALEGDHKFTDKEFLDALSWIERLVRDGVLSADVLAVSYDENISRFNNREALFMVQGQWVASQITNPLVSENMALMAWPDFPGQSAAVRDSVAASWSVGYGVTKSGSRKPAVRDAALLFIEYYNNAAEVGNRLRDGQITGPILKDFQIPEDLPSYVSQKLELARLSPETDVIDSFLSGAPNEALNMGMRMIAEGTATPYEVAAQVESLLRN
ncbi:ABC transporter substrate-binding protein [Breznakiella homolactica]|uniref:sn-glycerol-3-phosphate-binding periplasmic protein UgpB n=1 Tax=Breznakiella homolactica TaxID=2798577 RepID=A0A7T7XRK2_9SPIR|nr:extracellular solute-binding protein [Breznakiella homolactica]QQO11204.1 extracellular solute-binding protein [Breznakiella homolactica]